MDNSGITKCKSKPVCICIMCVQVCSYFHACVYWMGITEWKTGTSKDRKTSILILSDSNSSHV